MIICGTGHRPDKLGGYSDRAFERLVSIAHYGLRTLQPELVISGMALGWDQALAVACIRLKIPFVAAVPFRGQEKVWPDKSQRLYRRILARAHNVVIVSEGGYETGKMMKRNVWMIDHADAVLAMWNGDRKGGTWNAIQYAKSKRKKITNLYSTFKEAGFE